MMTSSSANATSQPDDDDDGVIFLGQTNQRSLFMHEFLFSIPLELEGSAAEKSIRYNNNMTLDQLRASLTQKRSYPIMTRAFLNTLFTIYFDTLKPTGLAFLEQLVVRNFNNFFLVFMYMLEAAVNHKRLPFKFKNNIKKVEINHNIARHDHMVSLQTAGLDIQLHFLAPTRKEALELALPDQQGRASKRPAPTADDVEKSAKTLARQGDDAAQPRQ